MGEQRPELEQQLRVAIVTSIHPDFDGRVWRHAKSLADRGCEVHLICPWDVPQGKHESGVNFHPFRSTTRSSPRARPQRWKRPILIPLRVGRALLRVVRRVDLVHFHDIDLLPWMALLAPFKPVVYDVHENYPDEMLVRSWVPKLLRRPLSVGVRIVQFCLACLIRNVVLVVPSQERDFASRRIRRFRMPNYASLDLAAGRACNYLEREDTIIFTGSNYESNGSLLILDIAELVVRSRPSAKFLVMDRFGSRRFRDRMVSSVASRRLDRVVLLVPQVKPPEIMTVLNRAAIGVLPALRVEKQIKALPTKLFEYMAAGLPVVASDLPAIAEILRESGAGLLASPEEPQTFADAIVSLLDDRREAMQTGERGYAAFTGKYNWEKRCDELLGYYRSCMANSDPFAA